MGNCGIMSTAVPLGCQAPASHPCHLSCASPTANFLECPTCRSSWSLCPVLGGLSSLWFNSGLRLLQLAKEQREQGLLRVEIVGSMLHGQTSAQNPRY